MAEWLRVKDRDTGHKFSIQKSVVDADPDVFQVLKQDALDHNGEPLPPEYADQTPAPSGQKATDNTSKES